jgi:hypothetical protein
MSIESFQTEKFFCNSSATPSLKRPLAIALSSGNRSADRVFPGDDYCQQPNPYHFVEKTQLGIAIQTREMNDESAFEMLFHFGQP